MDNKSRFLKAISVGEFTRLLDDINITSTQNERIPLTNLIGRVLSNDVSGEIDVPSFPKSTVDGYALKAKVTFGANEGKSISCQLVGSVEMGRAPPVAIVNETDCVYVPTGGFVPDGGEAVVKVEFTKAAAPSSKVVQIFKAVVPGDGVIAVGSDIRKGSLLLKSGAFITPARAGTLAAAGITSACSFKKLRVGLFSSGNEIVEPGMVLGPGMVYDVNSVTLKAMIEAAGCDVTFHGILADDLTSLVSKFSTILENNDVVICSGGTSKGRGDLMPEVIEQHPATVMQVHGVRIKPGKPIIMAIVCGKPVFVLPGNPVSAVMIMTHLVRPALRRWNHLPPESRKVLTAYLTERVYSEFGRLELKPVVLVESPDGAMHARPIPKGSETITTLIDADGYFEIPENVELVEKETRIDVILFS